MIGPNERCINHKCASNKECKHFVKARQLNEKPFYGIATLGQCEEFDELHKTWGEGKEVND